MALDELLKLQGFLCGLVNDSLDKGVRGLEGWLFCASWEYWEMTLRLYCWGAGLTDVAIGGGGML